MVPTNQEQNWAGKRWQRTLRPVFKICDADIEAMIYQVREDQ